MRVEAAIKNSAFFSMNVFQFFFSFFSVFFGSSPPPPVMRCVEAHLIVFLAHSSSVCFFRSGLTRCFASSLLHCSPLRRCSVLALSAPSTIYDRLYVEARLWAMNRTYRWRLGLYCNCVCLKEWEFTVEGGTTDLLNPVARCKSRESSHESLPLAGARKQDKHWQVHGYGVLLISRSAFESRRSVIREIRSNSVADSTSSLSPKLRLVQAMYKSTRTEG